MKNSKKEAQTFQCLWCSAWRVDGKCIGCSGHLNHYRHLFLPLLPLLPAP